MGQLVGIQTQGLAELARDIRAADKQLGRLLPKKLKKAGDIVATEARSQSSWSKRIPTSIVVRGGAKSVLVKAGGAAAPQAYTFEAPEGVPVRHPVFPGRRTAGGGKRRLPRSKWTWVTQAPRPFMRTALAAKENEVLDAFAEVVDELAGLAGFK